MISLKLLVLVVIGILLPITAYAESFYEVLGVPQNANEKTIRKKYYELAKKYHPDKADPDKATEEIIAKINSAYETLSDAEKRREYDHNLKYGRDPNSSPFGSRHHGGHGHGFGQSRQRYTYTYTYTTNNKRTYFSRESDDYDYYTGGRRFGGLFDDLFSSFNVTSGKGIFEMLKDLIVYTLNFLWTTFFISKVTDRDFSTLSLVSQVAIAIMSIGIIAIVRKVYKSLHK